MRRLIVEYDDVDDSSDDFDEYKDWTPESDDEQPEENGPQLVPVDPDNMWGKGGTHDQLRAMAGLPPHEPEPYEGLDFGPPPLNADAYTLAKHFGATDEEAQKIKRYYSWKPDGSPLGAGGIRPAKEATPENVLEQLYFDRAEKAFRGMGGPSPMVSWQGPPSAHEMWNFWNRQGHQAQQRLAQITAASPAHRWAKENRRGKVLDQSPGGRRANEPEQHHQASKYSFEHQPEINAQIDAIHPGGGRGAWDAHLAGELTRDEYDQKMAQMDEVHRMAQKYGIDNQSRWAQFWKNPPSLLDRMGPRGHEATAPDIDYDDVQTDREAIKNKSMAFLR